MWFSRMCLQISLLHTPTRKSATTENKSGPLFSSPPLLRNILGCHCCLQCRIWPVKAASTSLTAQWLYGHVTSHDFFLLKATKAQFRVRSWYFLHLPLCVLTSLREPNLHNPDVAAQR